jgi:hypothetical protein
LVQPQPQPVPDGSSVSEVSGARVRVLTQEMAMGRSLRTPRNPDLFGRVVAALRVMSGQRAPMNALEQSLQAELAGRQIHSRVAQQLIATFDATPRAARRRLLGDIGFPTSWARRRW